MAYNQSTSQTAQQPRNEFSTSIKYVCCKDSDKNSVKEIAAFIFDVFMNAVRKFFFTADPLEVLLLFTGEEIQLIPFLGGYSIYF